MRAEYEGLKGGKDALVTKMNMLIQCIATNRVDCYSFYGIESC